MNKAFENRGIQDTQVLLRNYLQSVIKQGDKVIDATAGRGRDTLFLAKCVGSIGKVFAFDIQEEAIKSTQQLLAEHGLSDRVQLFQVSHDEIPAYVPGGISVAVFNLGYLPGSYKGITTKAETTIQAVMKTLKLLIERGIIILTIYRGHQGGLSEANALENFLAELPKKEYSVLQGVYLNQGELSPYWIMIQKNREDI